MPLKIAKQSFCTTLANWSSSSNSPCPITKAQVIWYLMPFTITQFPLHVDKSFASCTCNSCSTWANSLSAIFWWSYKMTLKGSPQQILGNTHFWHYYVHVHGTVCIHYDAPCALMVTILDSVPLRSRLALKAVFFFLIIKKTFSSLSSRRLAPPMHLNVADENQFGNFT